MMHDSGDGINKPKNTLGAQKADVEKKRIGWIDQAKGIGLMLVMFGHCYLDEKLTFLFLAFHMPLFFFLSGYTFRGRGNYLTFVVNKARSLLIPYAFLAVVLILVDGVFATVYGRSYSFVNAGISFLLQRRHTVLWFLTCLFLMEQVLYWVERAENYARNTDLYYAVLGVLFFALFIVYREFVGIDLVWNLDLVLPALPFACLGKICCSLDKRFVCKKTTLWICLAVATALLCVSSFINWSFFGKTDWYSNAYGNYFLFTIGAVSGVLVVIVLSKLYNCKFLCWLGKNTLAFYGLHRIVLDYLFVLFGKLRITAPNDSVLYLLISVAAVLLAVALLTPVNAVVMRFVPCLLGKKRNQHIGARQ